MENTMDAGELNRRLLDEEPEGREDSASPEAGQGHREITDGEHHYGSWWPQPDSDRFLRSIYQYYVTKGYTNTVSTILVNFMSVIVVGFVILLVTVVISYKDLHSRLHDEPCGREPDALVSVDCHGAQPIAFRRLVEMPAGAYLALVLVLVCWGGFFVVSVRRLPYMRSIREFYRDELKIDHRQLQTIQWDAVLEKLVASQERTRFINTNGHLDELALTHLITRRSNYIVAMFNSDVIQDSITVALPCLGKRVFMTKYLKWLVDLVLEFYVFDQNKINAKILGEDKQREQVAADISLCFKIFGALAFIFSPLALLGRVAVFSFHHSDQLRKSSSPLSTRHWSPYARERLRNYCEVDHVFAQRLNHARKPASRYVASFTSEFAAIWARFLAFVVGGFLVILVALGILYEDEFLFSDLTPGHSVTFWLGVLGALLAILHSFIPEENTVLDRSQEFREVVKHTQFFPDHWKGKEHSLDVNDEFQQLFQFKGITLVEELLGLALFMPYILFFKLPQCSQSIVDFFGDNTTYTEGVGHVCRLAQLDKVGNREATGVEESMSGSVELDPDLDGAGPHRKAQYSKMKMSMLHFKEQHKTWLPEAPAQQIIKESESVIAAEYPGREFEHSLHEAYLSQMNTGSFAGNSFDGAPQRYPAHASHAAAQQHQPQREVNLAPLRQLLSNLRAWQLTVHDTMGQEEYALKVCELAAAAAHEDASGVVQQFLAQYTGWDPARQQFARQEECNLLVGVILQALHQAPGGSHVS